MKEWIARTKPNKKSPIWIVFFFLWLVSIMQPPPGHIEIAQCRSVREHQHGLVQDEDDQQGR